MPGEKSRAFYESVHFVNDIENGLKGLFKWLLLMLIFLVLLSWWYGNYILHMSFENNVNSILFLIASYIVLVGFLYWTSRTPRSVDITPNSILMELRWGRTAIIPLDKRIWVMVLIDHRTENDPRKDVGHVDVGRFTPPFQTTYYVKREIALEIREAFRAYRGFYPPNHWESPPKITWGFIRRGYD
jgi:hypothetical protein